MTEAEAMAIAASRWSCQPHRIPLAEADQPQYLFTRSPSVEAIGVAHYREVEKPFAGERGLACSPDLWQRARFLCCTLAFVVIVNAPDGLWFATVRDFDRDARAVKPRELGMDSRAMFIVPRELFKVLKAEGAKVGPGTRAA